MGWFKRLELLPLLFSVLVAGATLELASFVLTKAHLLLVNETPRMYRAGSVAAEGGDASGWLTERDPWGAWHRPNARATHSKSCFTVEYRSNEVGARDTAFSETKTTAAPRFILLGDSFAEGFGVGQEETAQRQIERMAGVEVLNFGSAGDFGPVQYWMVYERLAKRYQHDGVIIFFLPGNDFTDNDYDYWSAVGLNRLGSGPAERYRPYYRKTSAGAYEVFVPDRAVQRDTWSADPGSARSWSLESFVVDHFWIGNLARTFKVAVLARRIERGQATATGVKRRYSGYFDASAAQQAAAVHFIDTLIAGSPAKQILLVAIPRPEDVRRVDAGMRRDSMPWWQAFSTAESRLGKKVVFLDLLDHRRAPRDELFLKCDGHWSAGGNRWAAEAVSARIKAMTF